MPSKGGATTRTTRQQWCYDQVKQLRKKGFLHVQGRCEGKNDDGSKCTKSARELHHDDYDKPDKVKYYCASHNRKLGKGKHA